MKKKNFQDLPNTDTPIKASTLNEMQSNIEESCVEVSPTQPETGEKVWIDNENNIIKAKNNDGTFKTIYDESKMNKTNYSTEEQVIGTWFGKPLYMKTIVYTSGWIIGGEASLTHGIANLDEIVSYKAKYLRSDGSTQFIPTIHADIQRWASGIYDFSSTGFNIYIGTLNNNFTINKLIITLEYTKTTDA